MSSDNYLIIWKHFDKGSGIGNHLKINEAFSLPYFIDGEDKERFEKQEPADLHALHLIKGLLVGYFDKPPNTDTSIAQQKTAEILREHQEMFQANTLEDLILDFSAHIREQHGPKTSMQALITGVEILPDSNSIKYDCCLDLYNCIEDNELPDESAAIQKLVVLFKEIDTKVLNDEMKENYDVLREEVERLGQN